MSSPSYSPPGSCVKTEASSSPPQRVHSTTPCLKRLGGGLHHQTKHPAQVARRNERERKRVQQVNNGFVKLRDHISPQLQGSKKLSKVETLRQAAHYIKYLQAVLSGANPPPVAPPQGFGTALQASFADPRGFPAANQDLQRLPVASEAASLSPYFPCDYSSSPDLSPAFPAYASAASEHFRSAASDHFRSAASEHFRSATAASGAPSADFLINNCNAAELAALSGGQEPKSSPSDSTASSQQSFEAFEQGYPFANFMPYS